MYNVYCNIIYVDLINRGLIIINNSNPPPQSNKELVWEDIVI